MSLLFRLTFTPPPDADRDEVVDGAERLLAALTLGGHIPATTPPTAWQRDQYVAYLNLIAPDALDAPYLPAEPLQRLQDAGILVMWTDLSEDLDPPPPDTPDALMLFSSMFWVGSPISDLEQNPAPPYRLGLSGTLSQEVYLWARRCAALDRLYIDSGVLEPEAKEQLSDPGAALITDGRALAREVEARSRIPTFVYLLQPEPQAGEPCPGCGQPWMPHDGGGLITRKCRPCRLVTSGAR